MAASLTVEQADEALLQAERIHAQLPTVEHGTAGKPRVHREAVINPHIMEEGELLPEELELLAKLEGICQTLFGLLKEHSSGAAALGDTYGGDRIPRLHRLLDNCPEHVKKDKRWQTCWYACTNAEQQLQQPQRGDTAGEPPAFAGRASLHPPGYETGRPVGLTPLPSGASSVAPTQGREARPEYRDPDGIVYTGEWRGRRRDGNGVQVWPAGQRYEGQFVRDGVHGHGCYSQADGLTYAGQWSSGKKHGDGRETFPDGTEYEGQYKTNDWSGKGKFVCSNGSVYEGQFWENMIHGEGAYIWADGQQGRKYQGQWRYNHMHGYGQFSFADGRRYEGEYEDDKKSGSGRFVWPDGSSYEGEWRCGRPDGEGTYTNQCGEVKSGLWKDGRAPRAARSRTLVATFQRCLGPLFDTGAGDDAVACNAVADGDQSEPPLDEDDDVPDERAGDFLDQGGDDGIHVGGQAPAHHRAPEEPIAGQAPAAALQQVPEEEDSIPGERDGEGAGGMPAASHAPTQQAAARAASRSADDAPPSSQAPAPASRSRATEDEDSLLAPMPMAISRASRAEEDMRRPAAKSLIQL